MRANPDWVEVAVGGTTEHHEICLECGRTMLVRVAAPESDDIVAVFCGQFGCPAFCRERVPQK